MISRYLSYRASELSDLQLLSKISLQTCEQYLPLSWLHTCHRTITSTCSMCVETPGTPHRIKHCHMYWGWVVWINAAQCQLFGFDSIPATLNLIFRYNLFRKNILNIPPNNFQVFIIEPWWRFLNTILPSCRPCTYGFCDGSRNSRMQSVRIR